MSPVCRFARFLRSGLSPLLLCAFALLTGFAGFAEGQGLPRFDFTKSEALRGWVAAHDVARLEPTPEGMKITLSGDDPYIAGPLRDYPANQPLWLKLRLKTPVAGMGQVFWFSPQKATNEPDSVRFAVAGGAWQEIKVPLPALRPGTGLRLDPPGGTGNVVLVSAISVEPRILLPAPEWPKFSAPQTPEAPTLRSGTLSLAYSPKQWNGFELRVNRKGLIGAQSSPKPLIGYTHNGKLTWLDLARETTVRLTTEKNVLTAETSLRDTDGALWSLKQTFTARKEDNPIAPGTIDVEVQVTVSADRTAVYLPLLTLHTVGPRAQALFSGLEYLDKDEPSSSEADIVGPGARRQVPDTAKITLPLMTVCTGTHYVGLIWEPQPDVAALFDSPDRLFHSPGAAMGLLFPGSDGSNREENSLLPYEGRTLQAHQPLIVRATLVAGEGTDVTAALKHYIVLRGTPPLPKTGVSWENYAALAVAGWLDSAIYEKGRFRHAYPGSFQPQPAADAAVMLDWLAQNTGNAALKLRAADAARTALAAVPKADLNTAGVSHVRYPVGSLLYGAVEESLKKAEQQARALLGRFEADGQIPYRVSPGGPDYGKTHFATEANGLTGQVVASQLEAAAFCGNAEQIAGGLKMLRLLDQRFLGTVPRGAQTWEVPLHTPDILASAHLVRANVLGYELSGGDPFFLKQAQYWAWTGVPFVYLTRPVPLPVGLYATIPVLGATQWIAPNWMGLPVQWCGLVYSDALYRLTRHDSNPLWKQLADGITASGVQQTWPAGSNAARQGLLPDSFSLRAQLRNDAAINPGTLLANAVRYYGKPVLYDFRAFNKGGLLVHAPGEIQSPQETPQKVTFTVQGWASRPYEILVTGLKIPPRVRINGKETPVAAPHRYYPETGVLILKLEGRAGVELLK